MGLSTARGLGLQGLPVGRTPPLQGGAAPTPAQPLVVSFQTCLLTWSWSPTPKAFRARQVTHLTRLGVT